MDPDGNRIELMEMAEDCLQFQGLRRLRALASVSYTHLRAHETVLDLVCRLLLEKKNTHRVIMSRQQLPVLRYNIVRNYNQHKTATTNHQR